MRHRTKFCADRSNRCGDMVVYIFSRWRPPAILDFTKYKILTAGTLLGPKMRHHAKFCADRSNRCGDMAVYNFSKMTADRHLFGFLKVQNFNCSYPSEGQSASSCQILCKSVKALRRYGRFRFFKMAAVRHLGFVMRVFGPPTKCILVVSITVQNLV